MLQKNIKKAFFLIIPLVFLSATSFGQRFFRVKDKEKQYSSVGIGGGTTNYFGDLAPYTYFYYGLISNIRWNATLNYTKQFTDQWAVRVGFSYIRLLGDANTFGSKGLGTPHMAQLYLKNLHFRNDLAEFTVSGVYDFLKPDGTGYKHRAKVIPYTAFGIGFFAMDPKGVSDPTLGADRLTVEAKGKWVSLRPLNNEGQGGAGNAKIYSKVQFTIPIALGLKIRLREDLNLGLEAGYRFTFTDYVDDVSTGAYVATNSQGIGYMSYRGYLNVNPRNGNSRISDYQRAAQTLGFTTDNNTAIDTPYFGEAYQDGAVYNGIKYARGTSRKDSYLITQFTLNYIIPSKIKCPK